MFIPELAQIRCGMGATARLVRSIQIDIVDTFDCHEFGRFRNAAKITGENLR